MKLIEQWVPGALREAVTVVNEKGWVSDTIQFVPATRVYVSGPCEGHWIVMRVSDARAREIAKQEARFPA